MTREKTYQYIDPSGNAYTISIDANGNQYVSPSVNTPSQGTTSVSDNQPEGFDSSNYGWTSPGKAYDSSGQYYPETTGYGNTFVRGGTPYDLAANPEPIPSDGYIGDSYTPQPYDKYNSGGNTGMRSFGNAYDTSYESGWAPGPAQSAYSGPGGYSGPGSYEIATPGYGLAANSPQNQYADVGSRYYNPYQVAWGGSEGYSGGYSPAPYGTGGGAWTETGDWGTTG